MHNSISIVLYDIHIDRGVLEKFAYKFDHDYSHDKSETFHFKLHVLFNEYVKIC